MSRYLMTTACFTTDRALVDPHRARHACPVSERVIVEIDELDLILHTYRTAPMCPWIPKETDLTKEALVSVIWDVEKDMCELAPIEQEDTWIVRIVFSIRPGGIADIIHPCIVRMNLSRPVRSIHGLVEIKFEYGCDHIDIGARVADDDGDRIHLGAEHLEGLKIEDDDRRVI